MSGKQSVGGKISCWWGKYIAPRTQTEPDEDGAEPNLPPRGSQSAARALSAKLRRGTYPAILFEPTVHKLMNDIGMREHQLRPFAAMVNVISTIREDTTDTLAKRLKGADEEPLMSHVRFKQLMTAEGDELADLMRRAVVLAGYKCNVGRLAQDMMFWNDQTRSRWCLEYFAVSKRDETKEQAGNA